MARPKFTLVPVDAGHPTPSNGEPAARLRAEYGISQPSMSRIVRGLQWADGPCPAWEIVKARRADARVETQGRKCHL